MLWNEQAAQELGPYKVLLKKGDIHDEARFNDDGSVRSVPFKMYYPSGDDVQGQKFPVIFWSHGYGGSRDGAGFIARFVASFGYIIVHLTHSGTDSSLWEGKPGHPWEILKNLQITRSTTLNRYLDISFVLDHFPAWLSQHPDIEAIFDWSAIGMSGHSFGAITTQVAAGQLTPDENNQLISLYEPRLTAGITYSPVPGSSHLSKDRPAQGDPADVYAGIKTPLLHMTGTEDVSPINGSPYTDRLRIYDHTVLAPKALLIKKGGDHMVYNGTRGALAANPLRDRHEDMIQRVSLAWWDAWLKKDEAARQWLQSGEIDAYLKDCAQWRCAFDV